MRYNGPHWEASGIFLLNERAGNSMHRRWGPGLFLVVQQLSDLPVWFFNPGGAE
jgi:hypothetical protein